MGNLCGAFCSTASPHPASGAPVSGAASSKEEAFMILILKVNVTKKGWERSVRKLLENCKDVKRVQMDESGRVEVSCIGNSDKVLKKIGSSRKLKHQWIQSGQCSSNLFIQEVSRKEETSSVKQQPPHHGHPHQMLTAAAEYDGYGGYGNRYGYNGYGSGYGYPYPYPYPYPTQLPLYYY